MQPPGPIPADHQSLPTFGQSSSSPPPGDVGIEDPAEAGQGRPKPNWQAAQPVDRTEACPTTGKGLRNCPFFDPSLVQAGSCCQNQNQSNNRYLLLLDRPAGPPKALVSWCCAPVGTELHRSQLYQTLGRLQPEIGDSLPPMLRRARRGRPQASIVRCLADSPLPPNRREPQSPTSRSRPLQLSSPLIMMELAATEAATCP
jgi:hypothetical protein